jgi:hypothetical protein
LYLDGHGPIDITLDLPAGRYSSAWINTRNGNVEKSDNFQHRGGEKVLRTPDFRNGIALRLKIRY